MENKMNEVAKLLGVELGEEFRIDDWSCKYKLTKDGFMYWSDYGQEWNCSRGIEELLTGNMKITKISKPILDDIEKEYLSSLIKPFRTRVVSITKLQGNYGEFISITIDEADGINNINLPWFKPDGMYKGMKIGKQYTLEELGL